MIRSIMIQKTNLVYQIYFEHKRYGDLKSEVAEAVVQVLQPIQEKYEQLINSSELDDILTEGAKKAANVANRTLHKAKRKMGLMRM